MRTQILRRAVLGALLSLPLSAQTFHGPTTYVSPADSPFPLGGGGFVLEDFEDGLLNSPGVTAPLGFVTSTHYGASLTDSVDSDDGVINGTCANGDSYYGNTAIVRFQFNALALGGLPRKAGLVWTDGGPNATVTFEAFDGSGVSLGTVVATGQGDNTYFNTTAEDRFYGVEYSGGISEIKISHTFGGLEVDHLQYELPCPTAAATTYCTAKTSSIGCVPSIGLQGCPSASSPTPCYVTCSQVISNKSGLLFYGFASAGAPFQGGFLCVAPPTHRTALQTSGGNPPPDDCSGQFSFDFNAHIQSGIDTNLVPGATVFAQYWYRDPASPSTTGLSNGVSFGVGP